MQISGEVGLCTGLECSSSLPADLHWSCLVVVMMPGLRVLTAACICSRLLRPCGLQLALLYALEVCFGSTSGNSKFPRLQRPSSRSEEITNFLKLGELRLALSVIVGWSLRLQSL